MAKLYKKVCKKYALRSVKTLNEQVKFVGKKLIRLILLLIAVCVSTFILMDLSPIDPVTAYVGANAMQISPEKRAQIEEHWGLNDPMPVRFVKWGKSILKGDFGTSMIYKRPVLEIIKQKASSSALLMLVSWLLSGLLGYFLALLAGAKEGTWIDKLIKGYCYLLQSTPSFWLCLLLIIVFSVSLGWFPIALSTPIGVLSENVSIWDKIHHMVLPAITLSVIGIASITLHTRQKLVDVMSSDYVLFAKARGQKMSEIIKNHGMQNTLLPFITLQFLSFSELFAGAVIAEQIFSYPGLGQATVEAGTKGDIPLLLGIIIFTTIFIFTGNLIADILYAVIDPRIKKGVSL
ncbi:MAG: ABC transporter permease [Clostridia bacterium]|nr:ABC transporter permease [Clostridia bacterium]